MGGTSSEQGCTRRHEPNVSEPWSLYKQYLFSSLLLLIVSWKGENKIINIQENHEKSAQFVTMPVKLKFALRSSQPFCIL